MNKFFRHMMLLTILFFAAGSVHAESMSLNEVVGTVLTNHPDLKTGEIDTAIAKTETQRIQGMLDPMFTARIGASEDKSPVSSDFQASSTRIGQLSGSIAKPLENGGTLGANFAYNRTSQTYNSPLAAQLSRFNPAYRNQINLTYRHPLLKGADRPDYHDSLIAAEAGIKSSTVQRAVIAHQLSLQAINAYYQLASDDINIRIAEQAVQRAKKLLSYQRSREQFGLIEKADRLQAEALLAARRTGLQRALSRRSTDLNRLNRLMLRPATSEIDIEQERHALIHLPSMQKAVELAEFHRPELRVLQAQMEAAEARLNMARETDDVQLDVVAEVGTRSLDTSAATAAARGFTPRNHYAALSLEMSDVLMRNSVSAGIRKAELQRQRIQSERISKLETIKSDLSAAMTAITSGRPVLEVARFQANAEKRKYNAEIKRYRAGRSNTATLVQFEGELRNAELNAELQALTLQLAARQLAWAQGTLLSDLGLSEQQTGQ
ncbi:outer membrane efflux protein [Mariprofundus micogutta]|uniref:Outer membrane efflux protein n=1 Tax=Mariprofundus micogutta TaxID=1921010 RepID=A0A1L8CPJ3_9PROT|nr:TolC family protein [Mariprofundus micogutta]GAV20804.1 outer membrane efflux protein [Mariprofundus micogutta]